MDWQTTLQDSRAAKDEAFRDDPDSPIPDAERETFQGLAYYPADERYRFDAKLVRETPKPIEIQRSSGDVVRYVRIGHFELTLPEGHVQLALYENHGHPFLPFRDATSGKETYGAGRYLDPPETDDDVFLLDFNEAYNPFCAYNEAYSCPFPPPENWFQIPILAGEKAYSST